MYVSIRYTARTLGTTSVWAIESRLYLTSFSGSLLFPPPENLGTRLDFTVRVSRHFDFQARAPSVSVSSGLLNERLGASFDEQVPRGSDVAQRASVHNWRFRIKISRLRDKSARWYGVSGRISFNKTRRQPRRQMFMVFSTIVFHPNALTTVKLRQIHITYRGGGRGGIHHCFMRGGGVPRSKPLPFYTPFFHRKGTPFVYFPQKIVPLLYTYGVTCTIFSLEKPLRILGWISRWVRLVEIVRKSHLIPKWQFSQPFSIPPAWKKVPLSTGRDSSRHSVSPVR